jgi:hypothetical protein
MQVNLTLTPGYRLKITRASRMSDLVDRTITGLGGSAAFLDSAAGSSAVRRSARNSSSSTSASWRKAIPCVREAYQREREAMQALGEEGERRHKAELAALEAPMAPPRKPGRGNGRRTTG